jgi:hypothetical protein
MNTPAALPRPEAKFYRSSTVLATSTEIVILGLALALVRKGLLDEQECLGAFSNTGDFSGGSTPHETEMTLAYWRDTLRWILANDPPGIRGNATKAA